MNEGNGGQIARATIIDVPMKGQRDLATVTAEIRAYQDAARRMALSYSIEIGRRLVEAKEMVSHGEWQSYLREELGFSQSTANNHMRLFEAYGSEQMTLTGAAVKSQAFAGLSYTQALELLALPSEEEREAFAETHDLAAMSTRDLREELRRRNEPVDETPASTACDPYAPPQPDQELLQARLDAAEEEAKTVGKRYDAAMEEIRARDIREDNLKGEVQNAKAKQKKAEDQARETQERLVQAKQELQKANAEAQKARADAQKAERELAEARKNPKIPQETMDKLRREAEEAVQKAKTADGKTVAEAEEMYRKANEEAAKARQEALAASMEKERLEKELKLASPGVAVFRDQFARLQKDLFQLITNANDLPEDKQAGARKGFRIVLQQALGMLKEPEGEVAE